MGPCGAVSAAVNGGIRGSQVVPGWQGPTGAGNPFCESTFLGGKTPFRDESSAQPASQSPIFSCLASGQAASGIPRRKASSQLCSPRTRSRVSSRKASRAGISGGLLSREELKEIADSTKRIALIAASRRSRAQDGGPGSELSSVYYLDDETLEVKRLQPSLTPEHSAKDAESADSLAGEPPRSRKKRKKERRREKTLEGEAGVTRSHSLELASPRVRGTGGQAGVGFGGRGTAMES